MAYIHFTVNHCIEVDLNELKKLPLDKGTFDDFRKLEDYNTKRFERMKELTKSQQVAAFSGAMYKLEDRIKALEKKYVSDPKKRYVQDPVTTKAHDLMTMVFNY